LAFGGFSGDFEKDNFFKFSLDNGENYRMQVNGVKFGD